MKKFFRIWATFFTLTFAAIFFAACGGDLEDGVTYVKLTGGDWYPGEYKISDYDYNTKEYFTKGYIYNKGIFGIEITSNNEKEGAVAEFKIVASSLRIEIYEGQTLPSGNYIYVYYGNKEETPQLIGKIEIIKIDDKPKFIYKEYDTYWW